MELGDLCRIESAFAEAAVDPSQWIRALEVVTQETRSFGAILLPITGGIIPNVPATRRLGEVTEHYFRDSWHLRDHRQAGIGLMLKNGVVDDIDIIDTDSIKKHPYYQEFLAPHDLRWFAGVKIACGNDIWCLSIQRRIQQGPFPSEDKALLGAISRSLSTSAALVRALGASTVEGALNAFELSNTAIALINRCGEVYRLNCAAEALLTGDVKVAGRRIVSRDPATTIALAHAIHTLMWGQRRAGMAPPVALPRTKGSPLLAYPAKLSALASNAMADCQAIVVFVDPNERRTAPEELLHSAFSLTPAEARLASRLATGASLENVSDEMRISKLTGRTHLKRIFAKLGIKRQSELAALLGAMGRF